MSEVNVDMGEVRAYSVDLGAVPGEFVRFGSPALKKAAQNIKTAMQADLRASSNAGIRFVAGTVTYDDIAATGTGLETEIGPEKPQGALANIAYFGTYKGGGHTRDPREAAEEEMPAFEAEIDKIVERLFR